MKSSCHNCLYRYLLGYCNYEHKEDDPYIGTCGYWVPKMKPKAKVSTKPPIIDKIEELTDINDLLRIRTCTNMRIKKLRKQGFTD